MHREFLAMMLYLFAVFSVGFSFCRIPGMRFDEAFDRGVSAFSVDCQTHKQGSRTSLVGLVPLNVKQHSEYPFHKYTEQATGNLPFDAFFWIFGQNKNPRKLRIYGDLLLFSVLFQRKVRKLNPFSNTQYINTLKFPLNRNTPNRPQYVCSYFPLNSLGYHKLTNIFPILQPKQPTTS